MRYAELKPQLPAHLIQPTAARLHNQQSEITELDRTLEVGSEQKTGMVHETLEEDEFDDHDFMDQDIVNAGKTISFCIIHTVKA